MLSHREPDKARHYLDLLDAARCNGRWHEVPELVRKVSKHAPHRQCLALTAQTEFWVATQSSQRPATLSSSATTELSQTIPLLARAIDREKTFHEDVFQAKICSAWVHWTIGQSADALAKTPPALDQTTEHLAREGGITAEWTHVCIIKGTYLRGDTLENAGNLKEAIETYHSMLPYISNANSTVGTTPEHRLWTERVLTRYCMLSGRHITAASRNPRMLLKSPSLTEPSSLLSSFRAWAEFWDDRHARTAGAQTPAKVESNIYRTGIWKAYYDALSILVQHHILNPLFKSMSQQTTELKSVEATYESILLQQMRFPKANQANPEIESWVDQVMANWLALCNPTVREEELGKGGRATLSRSVLEILYRAAMRTFHSTRILRHLFTVHAALAEFNLAGKALRSYFEILKKGKARVEKSGEVEPGLDDDATALCTAATGIHVFCVYGRRKEAEHAMEVASTIEAWLKKANPSSPHRSVTKPEGVPSNLVDKPKAPRTPVPNEVLALGYHAISLSQSRWARLTYETSSRSELQAKAISNCRMALRADFGDPENIEYIYLLALLLAETRDIDAAIMTTKHAISVGTRVASEVASRMENGNADIAQGSKADYNGRRLLLRCWHLLALLLSSRQNFSTAVASCEAAFEPYGAKATLYGDTQALDSINGLAMSEKKNLVEMRMTQLALSEVIDGPEEAVNASGELLGLYTKLFHYIEKSAPEKSDLRPPSPTTSANGTQRSFRESIFGMPKDPRKSRLANTGTASSSVGSFEQSNDETGAPAISVTSDQQIQLRQDPNHRHHFLGRHESNRLKKRNSRKSLGSVRRNHALSPAKSASLNAAHQKSPSGPSRDRAFEKANGSGNTFAAEDTPYASDEVGVAISHDMPSLPSTPIASTDPSNPLHNIPSTTQNMNHKNPNTDPVPPKPSQSSQPQSLSLLTPASFPEPQYSLHEQSRHALSLLIDIWLLIASLYRRAGMPTDAQGALTEATKHVQTIENGIASQSGSSAENFSSPGYGGVKSCGELWADVMAEQAAVQTALGNTEKASEIYETTLGHYPDHAAATIGLSYILLDSFENPDPASSVPPLENIPQSIPILGTFPATALSEPNSERTASASSHSLSHLAARDRAYGLLSALTKSGQGWDSSEAWFALARAYEEGGQIEQAKESLWWVVELEEGRGVRPWSAID